MVSLSGLDQDYSVLGVMMPATQWMEWAYFTCLKFTMEQLHSRVGKCVARFGQHTISRISKSCHSDIRLCFIKDSCKQKHWRRIWQNRGLCIPNLELRQHQTQNSVLLRGIYTLVHLLVVNRTIDSLYWILNLSQIEGKSNWWGRYEWQQQSLRLLLEAVKCCPCHRVIFCFCHKPR